MNYILIKNSPKKSYRISVFNEDLKKDLLTLGNRFEKDLRTILQSDPEKAFLINFKRLSLLNRLKKFGSFFRVIYY